MSSRSATWDAFDPLVDGLYCQAPCSDDEVVSESTFSAHWPDKATVRRYEEVARRYLSGHAPLLITSTLRGPFDRASGFVNPWARPVEASRATTQQPNSPTIPTKQSPAICEPATSPRLGETQTTESSYLPSPESLNLSTHPFLEHDEVARVQKWRDLVESNIPTREEFWASKTPSTKRAPEDSSWLKRRAPKRPRIVEPEPKLSSPVSIPDKNSRPLELSSPLSSLPSLGGQPTPREPSSQATAGIKAELDKVTVARTPQSALPSYSQRISQRSSQSSRLPPNSETLWIEKQHTRSPKSAVSKIPKRALSTHYLDPAVGSRDGPLTADDSATESESSQSTDDDVLETKQEIMESGGDKVAEIEKETKEPVSKIKQEVIKPVSNPTVFVESDEVVGGEDMTEQPQPGEGRVLQVIDANAIPRNGEKESDTSTIDGEDSVPTASKPIVDASLRKPTSLDPESQHQLTGRETFKRAVTNPPDASSSNPGLLSEEDSLGRRLEDKLASEHCYDGNEPAAAPDTAAADRSAPTSVTSAPSAADFASTTLAEDGGHLAANETQPPHERQILQFAVHDAVGRSESSLDNVTSEGESQPQQAETYSTPRMRNSAPIMPPDCRSREPSTPEQRIVTKKLSPWVKDPRDLLNEASVEDGQANGTLQEDEHAQLFVVPAESQSPWMQRPTSQPQAAINDLSLPGPSPRLPPPSQHKQEDPQPQAEADRSNLTSDVSNTDFSIKSFSSFMSPLKPRPRASDSYLPHTPSLLAAATENPWQSSSKLKKRVSWAPLPHEVDNNLDSPALTSSFSRASPPPAASIPDDVEEGGDVFKNHFATVKRRTDPVRQRLLPSASQQTQWSPETEAMARAFVAAESPLGPSSVEVEGLGQKQGQVDDVAGKKEGGQVMDEGPVDEVDDVLANLGDFLTTWDVETDLERARAEDRAGIATTRGILDVEIGGW